MIGKRLDRYIASTVLINISVTALIIIGLACLFSFVDQLKEIQNSYTIGEALQFVALTAPRRLYDTLPMAALVGSLIGLGSLASRSELTVMRAAGMSTGRIVFASLKPIFLIMVLSVTAGEFVIPHTESKAQANKELALASSFKFQFTLTGIWHRQGNEYINISTVQPNGLLIGVTRYYKEGEHIKYASQSEKAIFENGTWYLYNTKTTHFAENSTRMENSTKTLWPVDVSPKLLATINSDPSNLDLRGLWQYIHYLEDQNLNNENYWLAFWEKLLQPFDTLALVLLAISFIFGPLRTVSMGQRIFTGVVIGFSFKIFQSLLGPASLIFHFPPLLAVLTPILICLFIGLFLLKRKR